MKTIQHPPTALTTLLAPASRKRAETTQHPPTRRSLADRAFFLLMTALILSGIVKLETLPE